VREPCQVFVLLESLYAAFDAIAHRRRIFKVETIGDCYVAVCGLPEPREDHAVVMSKFANEILHAMHKMTRKLEITLGPDTGDLTLRIGLHSGPVTAGVLRGDRARFQLFGDTMNTAARMEQTGTKDKIQISQTTADQIVARGKRYVIPMQWRFFMFFHKFVLTVYIFFIIQAIGFDCGMIQLLRKEKVSSQRIGLR
jgi:class 3 adenylate cyclase